MQAYAEEIRLHVLHIRGGDLLAAEQIVECGIEVSDARLIAAPMEWGLHL